MRRFTFPKITEKFSLPCRMRRAPAIERANPDLYSVKNGMDETFTIPGKFYRKNNLYVLFDEIVNICCRILYAHGSHRCAARTSRYL